MTDYAFARMTADDLPMVKQWRREDHVRTWWGDPLLEPEEEKLHHPGIDAMIVKFRGRPFAFLQDYRVHAWTPHHFAYLPAGSRGIDLYIGEADMLDRGHGTLMVRAWLDQAFARGVPAIGTDPHPDNIRAQRAFEKAGFMRVSGPLDTRWGRGVLMEARA